MLKSKYVVSKKVTAYSGESHRTGAEGVRQQRCCLSLRQKDREKSKYVLLFGGLIV